MAPVLSLFSCLFSTVYAPQKETVKSQLEHTTRQAVRVSEIHRKQSFLIYFSSSSRNDPLSPSLSLLLLLILFLFMSISVQSHLWLIKDCVVALIRLNKTVYANWALARQGKPRQAGQYIFTRWHLGLGTCFALVRHCHAP